VSYPIDPELAPLLENVPKTPRDSSPLRFEEIDPVSINEFVLEPVTGPRPADRVTGPPEDWRAAVTGDRPPAGPDGYWPHHHLWDRDEPVPAEPAG
jgi:hypothetical protein